MQVAVTVGNQEIQFIPVRQEIRRDNLEVFRVLAEEGHFIWILL